MSQTVPLRQAALKGGAYLAGRQVVSIFLKLIGVMLITRVLGPAGYGAYVSAFNVYTYATLIGQVGVGVYLLRQEGEIAERSYATAYTILLAVAAVLLFALEAGTDELAGWIDVDGFEGAMRVIVFALPFQLLAVPATVRVERRLDYRSVAMLEITGQLAYYLIAIPLVTIGYGPTALAAAWLMQQVVTCIAAHIAAKTIPRFAFDPATAKGMAHYASTFSLANWIWQLRMLVNPLIVGPALGAQAVGLIGMTIGLLEMLSIIKTIAWRLSVAILAKIQSDVGRLRTAVTEGMELQTLAIGTTLLGFGWTGHVIVPHLFGERWAGVMDIYPYIALGYFTNALFNMHSSVLSLLLRNGHVAVFHFVHIALFGVTAWFLVPRLGIQGYGYSELMALFSYGVIHFYAAKAIGSPRYVPTVLWWSAVALGLFWREIGLWTIVLPFIALAVPPSPQRLMFYFRKVRER